MAYKVIILYQLYMPSYFLGTFTEYPYLFPPARQSRILQKKLPLCYIPGRDRCNSPKPIT